MIERPLAWLIGIANARGSSHVGFYDLKNRLLRRYGRRAGTDVQRIVDECFGYMDDGHCLGAKCTKCGGTGVFRTRLMLLERWELGGRVFHRPDRQVWGGEWKVTIEGYIRHYDVSSLSSSEAYLWLALLFDRRAWLKALRSSRHCGWQWRPMVALQSIVFQLRTRIRWSCCSGCDRRWFSGFDKAYHFYCPRCREAHRLLAADPDADLPF